VARHGRLTGRNQIRYDGLRSQGSGDDIDGGDGLTGPRNGPTEEARHA
jgi:hypothetical protein